MKVRKRTIADAANDTKAIVAARRTYDLYPLTSSLIGAGKASTSVDDTARSSIRLSFLIHDVSRMRRNAYDQYMKPFGITRAQWWVLAHLSRHDGMRQTQLADVLEVGKASLGAVIKNLEGADWINRRPDPTDTRAKRVYLTKPAHALIERMTALEVDFNDKVFGDLLVDEFSALFASLLKVKDALSRMYGPGGQC